MSLIQKYQIAVAVMALVIFGLDLLVVILATALRAERQDRKIDRGRRRQRRIERRQRPPQTLAGVESMRKGGRVS